MTGRTVSMDVIDRQVATLVERLQLPTDWREWLRELADFKEERGQVEGKRKSLQGKLRRLHDLYVEGDHSGRASGLQA